MFAAVYELVISYQGWIYVVDDGTGAGKGFVRKKNKGYCFF